ncbi:ABC transporter permease [Nocardia sp. NPDC004711]
MRWYVFRRIAGAVGVLWAAYTVSFLLLEYLPGDPVSAMAGGGLNAAPTDPAQLAALRAQYGFDKALPVQYLDDLGKALRGDFGDSVATGRPVTAMIGAALPPTLELTAAAVVLAVLFGAGLAFSATYTTRGWLRQLLLALPPLAISIPTFWLGLMLVQLLSFRARVFPAFGDTGVDALVLPAVTLAIPTGAVIAQLLARSLLATLDAPFVQTARAKGAGRVRVHVRHALRNASLPALTLLGLLIGQLLAGAVVIETVFSRNGLGRVMASAVSVQDIPLVQGVVVFGAFVFAMANLAVDLIFPLLDPRIVVAGRRGLG